MTFIQLSPLSFNNNKKFFKVVNGKSVGFYPADIRGNTIVYGANVIMPDPKGDDNWNQGGFLATVVDVDEIDSSLVIVEDGDGDFFTVEANRVELVEDNDDEEITHLKDEKNGLYPDKIDIAN